MQYEYQVTTLKNGTRISTVEMPWMQSVSMGIWAGVGGRHEKSDEVGLSHFVEHLLFKGTKRRNARQITADVEGVGGYLNAFTSEDHTCYYAKAGAQHFERVCDVLSDMYIRSEFPAQEIEREREVIREEILMVKDQPAQYAQELLSAALWPDHPLGRPLTGTAESITRYKRPDFREFVSSKYAGRNTVVAVAGKIAHKDVVSCVRKTMDRLAPGRALRFKPAPFKAGPPKVRCCAQETEQVQLALGFHAVGRSDEKRFALKLLSVILGENMSSRLFQELREKYGYCYSVHSCVSTFEETGMFGIAAGLDPKKLLPSVRVIQRELKKIREKAPGKKELQEAKDYAFGQTLLGLESTTNQMMWMGESILGYGRVIQPVEVEERVFKVTAEQVRAVAAEVLDPQRRMAVAVVGPIADADPVVRLLI